MTIFFSVNSVICSWTSMKQNIVAQSLDDKKITIDNWLCFLLFIMAFAERENSDKMYR